MGRAVRKMGPVKTIGMPRGLFYWQHDVIWETFFKELGIKLVTSGDTNTKIIGLGVKNAEDESCFSYKVFFGHILELVDKVDILFIPTYFSLAKNYVSCPKFTGIADVIKAQNLNKKSNIFSPVINLGKQNLEDILVKIGTQLGKKKENAKEAAKKAIESYQKDEQENNRKFATLMKQSGRKVLVFAHRYILEDKFVNFRILEKLEKIGLVPIPIHFIPYEERDNEFSWDFVGEELGKLKKLKIGRISGIIQLSSFNCGPDSVITEYLYDFTKKHKLPFLSLILDEQTGEAGINTRLEAFFDTIAFF